MKQDERGGKKTARLWGEGEPTERGSFSELPKRETLHEALH